MQKILLLEDDLNLNRGIALLLSREGYEVRQVYTIKEAKEAFQKGDYALVISDITLPDGTGLDFGRMVRAGGDTYLIYLTALDQEIDIVNGYDTGADDYITKPFSLMALVSKVNALMRRLSKVQAQIMSSGEITVHMKTMQVYKGDEPVTLSKKEFSLLLYLWENIVLPLGLDNRKVKPREVEDILKKIGLQDKKDAMPSALSGGQKQRTAIARALVTRPAIILADEPTGNLDSQTELEVMSLLKSCVSDFGQTLIMITHDETIAQMADEMIIIEDGKAVRR